MIKKNSTGTKSLSFGKNTLMKWKSRYYHTKVKTKIEILKIFKFWSIGTRLARKHGLENWNDNSKKIVGKTKKSKTKIDTHWVHFPIQGHLCTFTPNNPPH